MILKTRTSSELVFVPHSMHNNYLQITTKSKASFICDCESPPKSCMRNRKSVDNRRRETTGGKRRHVDLENVAWWTTTIFFVQNFLTRNKFYCAFETADKIESLFAYQDRLHLWIELKKQSPGCLYSDFIAFQFSYSLLHQNPYISLFLRSKLARSKI